MKKEFINYDPEGMILPKIEFIHLDPYGYNFKYVYKLKKDLHNLTISLAEIKWYDSKRKRIKKFKQALKQQREEVRNKLRDGYFENPYEKETHYVKLICACGISWAVKHVKIDKGLFTKIFYKK